MTLASTPPIVTYAENGSTLAHAVPFQFQAAADLQVTRQDPGGVRALATLGTDYTVAGGAGTTGTVTMIAAKPTGWTLEIRRFTPRTQPMDYTPGDTFPAESHEHALDRVTAIAQEIAADAADLAARALQVPKSETIAPMAAAADRADTVSGFSLTGAWRSFTRGALAAWLVSALVPLLPAGLRGDPGGNVESVGPFVAFPGRTVPAGTNRIRSTGMHADRKGGAVYDRWSAPMAALPSAGAGFWWATMANGAIFFLSPDQILNGFMFGLVDDFDWGTRTGTDNRPAWLAKDAFQDYFATPSQSPGFYNTMKPVTYSPGFYYFSDYIDYNRGAYTESGATGSSGFAGLGFCPVFAASALSGIVVNSYNTAGVNGLKSPGYSAGNSAFLNITPISLGNGSGGAAWAQDGWRIKTQVTMVGCSAKDWSRNNLRLQATSGSGDGTTEGLANDCEFYNFAAFAAGAANIFVGGADVNVSKFIGGSSHYAGTWALEETSFLGITVLNLQTATNGLWRASGPSWAIDAQRKAAGCSNGGTIYYVKRGQEANCATVTPGVTAGWQTVWGVTGAGGPSDFYPAYSPTLNFVQGGPYCTRGLNAPTLLIGCYSEQDQPPADLAQLTILFGGVQGAGVVGDGFYAFAQNGILKTSGGFGAIGADGSAATLRTDGGGTIFDLAIPGFAFNFQLAYNAAQKVFKARFAGSDNPLLSPFSIGLSGHTRQYQFMLDQIILAGHQHNYVSAPPSNASGGDRDIAWNDGTNGTYAAVDYWIKKAGAWTARP